jgi:hypothetical protein
LLLAIRDRDDIKSDMLGLFSEPEKFLLIPPHLYSTLYDAFHYAISIVCNESPGVLTFHLYFKGNSGTPSITNLSRELRRLSPKTSVPHQQRHSNIINTPNSPHSTITQLNPTTFKPKKKMTSPTEIVLTTPELLTTILTYLSPLDLLTRAQLVSRTWNTCIASSITLQQQLFFSPIPPNPNQIRTDTFQYSSELSFSLTGRSDAK